MGPRNILLCALAALVVSLGTAAAEEPNQLDWSAWQRLPVFHNGRMMPLDTFARLTADAVCGRQEPTLSLAGTGEEDAPEMAELKRLFPGGAPRKFSAAELLFSWIVEPQRWENVPLLWATNEELRQEWLAVPVSDTPGARRLAILGRTVFESRRGKRYKYVSPRQVQEADPYWDRLMTASRDNQGDESLQTEVERKARDLYNAFATYRMVTFNPSSPEANRSRFRQKLGEVLDCWNALEPNLQAIADTGGEGELPKLVSAAQVAMKKLAVLSGGSAPLDELEPPVAALAEAAAGLAAHLAEHRDRVLDDASGGLPQAQLHQIRSRLHALALAAAGLARQAGGAHLALYDNGYSLRLVPGLNPAALESGRDPEDDAQPWVNLQTLLVGSDVVLKDYPRQELAEFRESFAKAADAYLDRDAAGRNERFSEAIARFASATRRLAVAIEPIRKSLPLEEQDRELIALTAYPPPEATAAEVRYYRLDPFLWSWASGAGAMVFLGLAVGVVRKPAFWLGILALAVAVAFTIYGLGMRVQITGWAPVTNMFETVIFVALVVALLGLWFALYPLFGAGLETAWRMTAVPGTFEAGPLTQQQTDRGDRSWWNRIGWLLLLPRFALAAAIFAWLTLVPYGSGEGYTAISLLPRTDLGSSLPTLNDLTVWAVGMGVLLLTVIYVPRVLLALLLSVVLLPRSLAGRPLAGSIDKTLARKPFALAGAAVAFLAALVAYFAPISGKNLGPLMPVLRDNFWLTLHVLTITASYGAGALAWGLGNLSLGYFLFGRYRDPAGATADQGGLAIPESGNPSPKSSSLAAGPSPLGCRRPPEACEPLAAFIYKVTQVTVLLLAIGTILGALWADVSWGRFWGNDPKEIWALISTLVYLAVLHGRYIGWFGSFGMAVASVLGASAILMAWYGVNLLDSGLHTYGRVTGGIGIILTVVALNWAFALLASIRYVLATRLPPAAT